MYYEELNATYKPHWIRRSTKEKRIRKAKSAFDVLTTLALIVYIIGGVLWIFFDAFPM